LIFCGRFIYLPVPRNWGKTTFEISLQTASAGFGSLEPIPKHFGGYFNRFSKKGGYYLQKDSKTLNFTASGGVFSNSLKG
jgi:hypothetical protein